MKIDSTLPSRVQSVQDGVARTQQGGSASAGGAAGTNAAADANASGGDSTVSLSSSSLSSQLRSLAASGTADVDTAHVQSVKDALRNGTLQIDPGKIADGMLESSRGLVKPSSSGA